jgi:tetratricopeptide (TPR) repeat protein
MGGLAGALAGCTTLPPSAVREIENANQAYRSRDFDRAEDMLTPVIRSHPEIPDTAEAMYLRALCHIRLHRREAARADLKRAIPLSLRPELTALAYAQLGNLAFDEEDYPQAIGCYRQAVPGLPAQRPTDQVLYQYGLSLQRCGRFADARFAWADVVMDYDGSPYADAAERKLAWPYDHFSLQCGAFSKLDSARELAGELKARGFEARILRDPRAQSTLYMVYSGRHSTFASAVTEREAIRNIVHDVFIVP